ncbi:hypothetical protein BGX27_004761, partial [Mortierella sp. AM989]
PQQASHAKRRLDLPIEPPPKRQKAFSFPVDSVNDFKELRNNNYFYVDKTKYIKDIEQDRQVLMFLRPMRLGKSLFLSTLKYFYDVNEAASFDSLFGDLEIFQHASDLLHNQYLILYWNFSRVDCTCVEAMKQSLNDHVNDSVKNFCEAYAPILGINEEDAVSIINANNCLSSLEGIFRRVRSTNYKIYLLLDEYDYITNEFLDPTDAQSYGLVRQKQGLLKAILGVVKDSCSKEIARVFIT